MIYSITIGCLSALLSIIPVANMSRNLLRGKNAVKLKTLMMMENCEYLNGYMLRAARCKI